MQTHQSNLELYLSPIGNDAWTGRLSAPNADGSDGPFATFERARDELRKRSSRVHGAIVWLRGGNYERSQSFELDERDGGSAGAPVVYRAYPGESVRLLGGRLVTNFEPVTDPAILARLDAAARPHVMQADLRALGIAAAGRFRPRGFARTTAPAHLELFCDDKPMTVARWPNNAFTHIAGFPVETQHDDEHGHMIGSLENGFYYQGDRPKRWQRSDDIWLHGYWAWDWAPSYEQLTWIDTDKRHIKTRAPYGNWGFRAGNRFYFLNILEELDQPGEYYVDSPAGMLYFWPPATSASSETLASVVETPLVLFSAASHVELRDLVIEGGRGLGVQIDGGSDIVIAGCTLRNLGTHAVLIEGGAQHRIAGCHIYGTGDGGVFVSGGDRKTLVACDHHIDGNHLHDLSRWTRCYTPAIHASGVGIHMAHNLIHDLPHSGIIFWGNEMTIEYNEIHHVTLESADAGAIYTGRDYTTRGNLIRYNYIHDTGGYDWGTMAVYLDDCVSGQTIYGNLFVRVQRAAFIGGGRDNVVENNVFVDCKPAIWADARGLDQREVWHNMVYKTMKGRLEAMNHHQPPYSERYPELAQLDRYYEGNAGVPPEGNVIARNICVGGVWLESSWHEQASSYLALADNLTGADPHFVDPAHDDYRLCDDSPAIKLGFKPLPLEQIGPARE